KGLQCSVCHPETSVSVPTAPETAETVETAAEAVKTTGADAMTTPQQDGFEEPEKKSIPGYTALLLAFAGVLAYVIRRTR
ncbi:MAG: hypothetical protein J7J06_02840, partial [Methanosarcinales archaeon]|nr:hypothetical protein [Methanosarcinales archaeon]